MIAETLGLFVCLGVLWTIGLGPALWLNRRHPSRLVYSAAMAPAIGYALIGLLAFPLVRFVAPASAWTYPVTTLLVILSLALAALDWRYRPWSFKQLVPRRAAQVVIGLTLLVYAALASPLALRGIQYSIYRSNPHDAFLYMSLAESLRAVDWQTLQHGGSLTWANLGNIARLAEASPTALFAARQVSLPLILNKMAMLAWSAALTQTPIPLFYYAHHVLAFAVAWPLVPLLGQQLQLARWQSWLAAAAVTLGFWARFVLESDAGYEITVIPITLLFILAWMLLDEEAETAHSSARWLLALAGAAMFVLCLPVALIVAVGFVVYCGLGLVQRRLSTGAVGRHVYTGGMILLLLGLSGQLDIQLQGAINLFQRSANERAFGAPAFDLIKQDGLAALWGLPGSMLWAGRSLWVSWPLQQLAAGAGLLLSVTLAAGLLAGLRPQAHTSERRLFSLLAAAGLLAGVLLVTNNVRSAGKTFTYIYPMSILAVAAASRHLRVWLTGRAQRLAMGGLGAWMAAQAVIGIYLPLRRSPDFLAGDPRPEQYDLSAITTRLDADPPGLVAVEVPRGDTWMFAYYSMFIFSRYPVHFISGLIIDNGTRYQNLWLGALGSSPKYGVVLKAADQIGPRGLGTVLAETRELRLYRIDVAGLDAFLQAEAAYREVDASKPPFPTLETSP